MEQENKDSIEDVYSDYEKQLDMQKNIVMSLIDVDGKVIWYISDEITNEQALMFQKIAVVSEPSFVLLLFLKIEIFLLGLTLWFENKIKKEKK